MDTVGAAAVNVWPLLRAPGVSLPSSTQVKLLPMVPVPVRAIEVPKALPGSETPTLTLVMPAAAPSAATKLPS